MMTGALSGVRAPTPLQAEAGKEARGLEAEAAASADAVDQSWLKLDWFPAGHVLVPQGGKLGKLFVLREGEVEVDRDGTHISSVSQAGSIFGEMSLLLDMPHSATVRRMRRSIFGRGSDTISVSGSFAGGAWVSVTSRIAAASLDRIKVLTASVCCRCLMESTLIQSMLICEPDERTLST